MATNDIPTPPSPVDTPVEVMAVNWFGQGPTAKDLWAEVEKSSSPEEAAALYAKVEAELARTQTMAGKFGTPDLEVPMSQLTEHADDLQRISRRLRRVISENSRGPDETPAQRALREGAGGPRERTTAARKAFLLSESFGSAANAALQAAAALNAPPAPIAPVASRSNADEAAAARRNLREAAAAARTASVARFLAEVAYRAIPFDEEDKAPHREVIIQEAHDEAAKLLSAPGAAGNEALAEAAALVAEAVGDCAEADVCTGLVAAAAADASLPLSAAVSEAASRIERRVVAVAAAERLRSARIENLAEAARNAGGTEGADPELRVLRATRALDTTPTILEALFIANGKLLSEAVGSGVPIDSDLVVAESVGQYTVLETLSAFGLLSLGAGQDLDAAAKRIARAAA